VNTFALLGRSAAALRLLCPPIRAYHRSPGLLQISFPVIVESPMNTLNSLNLLLTCTCGYTGGQQVYGMSVDVINSYDEAGWESSGIHDMLWESHGKAAMYHDLPKRYTHNPQGAVHP
jgi:hypothetical protein